MLIEASLTPARASPRAPSRSIRPIPSNRLTHLLRSRFERGDPPTAVMVYMDHNSGGGAFGEDPTVPACSTDAAGMKRPSRAGCQICTLSRRLQGRATNLSRSTRGAHDDPEDQPEQPSPLHQ